VAELDGWRHCPVCGKAVEPEEGRVECPACGFVAFAHSMPTASAVVVHDDGRVLLSRRANDPAAGKWDIPGGFVEEGEHPLDCARRELREEAGISLVDEQLLGLWMDEYDYRGRRVATLNVYYRARVGKGMPTAADDVAELRWFGLTDVPVDDLAFGHIPDVLSTLRSGDEHA